ncbi:MAG: UDP-N-acetylglucosamine 2-epimerase [candidate division TM6 bacterium GW2011_GWF2_37_49]|nr:MAG: UDP-N-acetylglucosamine 2-epimerase [candidate division TM6 bacterium GW2011_GWF2_37_49]
MERPIVVVIGTRPEAIKLLLLHKELNKAGLISILVSTNQHSELLEQVFSIFNIYPDINLNIMIQNQDLFHITSSVLEKMKIIYSKLNPRLVIVQGDTTTAFAASLAAFYAKIQIAHVEAGLRSGNFQSPYPEEMNRVYISHIADYNFAPTHLSYANLLASGINRKKIFLTGNTVVDSLFWIKKRILSGEISVDQEILDQVRFCKKESKKIILLTAHRRETFNEGLLRIFKCIKIFIENRQDVVLFYPLHPNPNIKKALLDSKLSDANNVFLSSPLLYKNLIYLLLNCDFVLTDSGGIQEEAMSLGKQVVILRDVTERMEGVWEGLGMLVGSNETLLTKALQEFCDNKLSAIPSNIFGDGNSVYKIGQIIKYKLKNEIKNFNHDVFGSERIIKNV